MKKKFDLRIIAIITILMIGMCGCTMNNTKLPDNIDSKVTLNERQKSILAEEGLPTNYEELNITQKAAIVAIEEMLCETEEKYGISFSYISYSDGQLLGYEELAAYPSSGDKRADIFVITRSKENGSYVYSDGYANLVAKPVFNQVVQEFVLSKVGQGNAKVYSVVTNISNGAYPVESEDIANNVSGDSWIFIDGSKINKTNFDLFITEYKDWIAQNGISGSTQIILLFVN